MVKIAQRQATDPVVATYDVYDSAGNLTDVWLPAVTNAISGQSVRPHWQYVYDSAGNQVSQTDPNQDTTTYTFDEMGNMISRSLPDGEKETWTYNAYGQMVTDKLYAIDGTVAKTTWDVYDDSASAAGRLAAEYRYNFNFTPTTTTNPESPAAYAEKTVYTYDDATTLPSAEQTDQGRVAEVDEYVNVDGTITQTWFTHTTYDPLSGQTATITTPDGTIHYSYVPATGEPAETWVTHPGSSVVSNDTVYTYDQLGRLTDVYEVVLNDVRYGTFAGLNGDLPSFEGATPPVTVYTYDAMGNLFSQALPDGVTTAYTYDDLYRLVEVLSTNTSSGQRIFMQVYDLLSNGLRADSTDTQYNAGGTVYSQVFVSWAYDGDGRLTSESETVVNDGTGGITDANAHAPAPYTDTYAYDLANNRVQEQIKNGAGTVTQTIDYAYDADDQLKSETDNATYQTLYTYDAAGNQIEKTVYRITDGVVGTTFTQDDVYTWDLRNRMTGVTTRTSPTSTPVVTTYAYDSNGVLISESTGGTTTYYLNDPQNPTGYTKAVEQGTSENGAPVTSYLLGLDVIAQNTSTISGTLSYYLLHDGHGSTRALLDGGGNVVQRYAYDAFGDALGFDPATAKTVWLFGGDGEYDPASGFTYQLARWRDGFSFLSSDPTRGDSQDPVSLHKYLYAAADPVMYLDRSGHEAEEVEGSLTIGALLDTVFARGVQIASRFAQPLIGLLSSGAAWLVGQGQNALEFLRTQGTAGIAFIQQAFLHQQEIISEEEAEAGPVWNSFQAAKNYLNNLITGGENNPEGIQWHHLVTQASGFAQNLINSAVNLVPTPTAIHQMITGFFNSAPEWLPEEYSRVQDFVTTLNWQQQYEIGLRIWQSAMYYGSIDPEVVIKFIR